MIRPVSFRLPPELIEGIDVARGDVARTRWVQRALERALEQETGTGTAASVGETPGEAGNGADASSPARAPVAQRIEGQTTVDEMLVSCPNCAGELTDNGTVVYCSECAYVRERT